MIYFPSQIFPFSLPFSYAVLPFTPSVTEAPFGLTLASHHFWSAVETSSSLSCATGEGNQMTNVTTIHDLQNILCSRIPLMLMHQIIFKTLQFQPSTHYMFVYLNELGLCQNIRSLPVHTEGTLATPFWWVQIKLLTLRLCSGCCPRVRWRFASANHLFSNKWRLWKISHGKCINKNDTVEIWLKARKAGCNRKEVVSGCVPLERDHTAPAGLPWHGQRDLAPLLPTALWKLQFPILMQTSAKAYREARGEREKKKSISIHCADIVHLCYSNFSHLSEGLEDARWVILRTLCYARERALWLRHALKMLTASSHAHLCPHKGGPCDLRLKFKSKFSSSLAYINRGLHNCKERSFNH